MSYWIDMVRFVRRKDWDMAGIAFGEMWTWAERNAIDSHIDRPWSPWSYSQMLSQLYPDQIPF